MSLLSWLDKLATHQRQSPAQNAIGGNAATWSTVASSIPCALWPNGSSVGRTFARRDIVGTHVIVTDRDLGAKAKDRLLIDGLYYLVEGVQPFRNAMIGIELAYVIDVSLRTI